MISTRNLSLLPNIEELRLLLQSLAMLDAILEEKWDYRYYSYNAKWSKNSEVAFMRNGSGDEYFAMFRSNGAIIKGFAHESIMSPYGKNPPSVWPNVLDNVPNEFSEFIKEPAYSAVDTTFCIWRMVQESSWQCGKIEFPNGKDPDGSEELLAILDGNPETYQAWSEGYYEHPVNLDAIKRIYAHNPLTNSLVTELNQKASLHHVNEEAKTIGYSK
jgi:hypothetical protein